MILFITLLACTDEPLKEGGTDMSWAVLDHNITNSLGDAYKNCTVTTTYDFENDGADESNTAVYDDRSALIAYDSTAISYDWNSDDDVTQMRYDYDHDGTVDYVRDYTWAAPGLLSQFDEDTNNNGTIDYSNAYTYNDDGTLDTIQLITDDDGVGDHCWLSYEAEPVRLIWTTCQFGEDSLHVLYHLDEEGQLIYSREEGTEFEEIYNTFDGVGDLIEQERMLLINGYMRTYSEERLYSQGRIVGRSGEYISWLDGEISSTSDYTYSYTNDCP